MSPKFQIVLVRHGETDWNKMKIMQGHSNVPLNETGKTQALAVGELLKDKKFTFVYSSDLQRASLTCELLLSKNLFVSDEDKMLSAVTLDVRLRERTFGAMEGKPVAEVVEAAKQEHKSMRDYVAKGGESLEEIKQRAKTFFTYLCDDINKKLKSGSYDIDNQEVTVLVVTHGGFIRALFSVWIDEFGCTNGDSNHKSFNIIVGNASYSCVDVALDSKPDENKKIMFQPNSVTCTSFNVNPDVNTSI